MAKRSRKFGAVMALTVVMIGAAGAYIATPFLAAWSIREAIRNNDSAYLENRIEWESVRSTLKVSLAEFAFNASGDIAELPKKPGIWQRLKAYVGKGAVDRFVDATITPTGMAGLLSLRKTYKDGIESISATTGAAPAEEPSRFQRMRAVWSRVTRAEFASMSRFEMDMLDKDDPSRTVSCVLELRGMEWKLTELRLRATSREGTLQATRLVTM